MNRIGAVMLGASALIAATVDSGRARSAEVPNASQVRSVPAVTESSRPQSTPLADLIPPAVPILARTGVFLRRRQRSGGRFRTPPDAPRRGGSQPGAR
jgi:hypothetical protein